VRLFAGCGIVAGSDPAAELAESAAKLVPMRSALAAGPLAGPSDD
jgi:menaquinone-specific isochorismate synthase